MGLTRSHLPWLPAVLVFAGGGTVVLCGCVRRIESPVSDVRVAEKDGRRVLVVSVPERKGLAVRKPLSVATMVILLAACIRSWHRGAVVQYLCLSISVVLALAGVLLEAAARCALVHLRVARYPGWLPTAASWLIVGAQLCAALAMVAIVRAALRASARCAPSWPGNLQ